MEEKEKKARLRAEVILKVRSGQITATEGAETLGVSRKTYYQWEKKGLAGLMEALVEKDSGRKPKEADEEKEKLRKQVEDLKGEAMILRSSLRIKDVMEGEIEFPSGTKTEKKDGRGKKR